MNACLVTHSCLTLCDPMGLWSAMLLRPWNSPGKNTGVYGHSLHQRLFPTQGLNPRLLHCRWILYRLSHQGSPRTGLGYELNHHGLSSSPVAETHNKAIKQKDSSGCWIQENQEKGDIEIITTARKLKMIVTWIWVVDVETGEKRSVCMDWGYILEAEMIRYLPVN